MSTYKTDNPLGSAAVKDLFDNAENLDFALNSLTALIWTDRLGKTRRSFFGMESAFVTQLTSQESRFNTFIQSSGYQIIGDYTAGPLTITEYNQLIRYNNELYKLTAATDIPFTTAGNTDETWTGTDAAHFVSVGDAALRQDLGSSEGSILSGYRHSNVYSALSRIKTLYDYGVSTTYGHNLAADSQVRHDAVDDNDLLIPGNVSIAKEVRGVGRDGAALSVRLGTGDDSGHGFWPQVTAVSSTAQLANHGDGTPDGVAAFIDATSNAYELWEDVSADDVTYSGSGCTLTSDTTKIKPGNVIKTKHETPYIGIISSISGGVVTLRDGWVAIGGTDSETPESGYGLNINPSNKSWAINSNLTLSSAGRGTLGVVQELGIINKKGYNAEIGAIDAVALATSTYDSGYGMRVRPANSSSYRFRYGYQALGCQYGFYSSGGAGFNPTYGLFVSGAHAAGALFSGVGAGNIAIQVQNSGGLSRTVINGDGYVQKMHRNTIVAADSTLTVPGVYIDIVSVVAINQVITLSNSGEVPRTVSVEKFNSVGTLAVKPASGNILYNGIYVANVSITGAGKIELRLINITSDGLYQWAANIYQGV
ncbi:TPA: hypothetical protein MYJ36_003654 [Klebsiella quasipneumoniae]|nr:hypothetical protein [Klebsiella quasipneumoniae]